jgi:hypothetical protein
MRWTSAGPQGELLRAQAAQAPGWYWVCRPLSTGDRRYDPARRLMLPVWIDGRGVRSPLSDLPSLDPDALAPVDAGTGRRHRTDFAGPIAPGAPSGSLRAGSPPVGEAPAAPGWVWVRTRAPLLHVDDQGIGPVYLHPRDGVTWAWSAARPDGGPVDVFELGFAEPLVTARGVIDGAGEAGRVQAEFFGPIALPEGPLPSASAGG